VGGTMALAMAIVALSVFVGTSSTGGSRAAASPSPTAIQAALAVGDIDNVLDSFNEGVHLLCPSYQIGNNCLKPANGNLCDGCLVNVNGKSWNMDLTIIGKVCNNESGDSDCIFGNPAPFTGGSGLNTKYDKHRVYRIQFHANENYCLSSQGDIGAAVVSFKCNSSLNQLWVSSGYWLVNVGSSNNASKAGYDTDRSRVVLADQGASSCSGSGTAYVLRNPTGGCNNSWHTE
jgi:hypothetical protein